MSSEFRFPELLSQLSAVHESLQKESELIQKEIHDLKSQNAVFKVQESERLSASKKASLGKQPKSRQGKASRSGGLMDSPLASSSQGDSERVPPIPIGSNLIEINESGSPMSMEIVFEETRTFMEAKEQSSNIEGDPRLRCSTLDRIVPATRQEQLIAFLDARDSSLSADIYYYVEQGLLMASAALPLLQTVDFWPLPSSTSSVLEGILDFYFTSVFGIRFMVSEDKRDFFCDVFNAIDFVAALIFVLYLLFIAVIGLDDVGGLLLAFSLWTPIIRLLKMLRRWEKVHLLVSAFSACKEALPVLIYVFAVAVLTFATLVYLIEPRDNIKSYGVAVWFTIVTMTTVGYGDYTPVTWIGSVVVGIEVIASLLFMAMPIGIIGGAFTDAWHDRDRIMLVRSLHHRLESHGLTVHDVPDLFHQLEDPDEKGITIQGFEAALNKLRIPFCSVRAYHLFSSISPGHDVLSEHDFVRYLFPHEFVQIYGHGQKSCKS